jgi:hypothetical protein
MPESSSSSSSSSIFWSVAGGQGLAGVATQISSLIGGSKGIKRDASLTAQASGGRGNVRRRHKGRIADVSKASRFIPSFSDPYSGALRPILLRSRMTATQLYRTGKMNKGNRDRSFARTTEQETITIARGRSIDVNCPSERLGTFLRRCQSAKKYRNYTDGDSSAVNLPGPTCFTPFKR